MNDQCIIDDMEETIERNKGTAVIPNGIVKGAYEILGMDISSRSYQ